MLVMSNADNNNNKFYELKLEDNDEVIIRYGRVGASGAVESKGFGEDTFNKVANSKRKKGYKDVNILTTETAAKPSSSNLLEIAKRDIIKNDPILEKLLIKLEKINRHQLLSVSGGNIDIVNGQVQTPLGLVTLDSVSEAKKKLLSLNQFVTTNDLTREYISTLEEYLTLVPQKIPSRRGWHNNFFTEFTNFQNQNSLLEQIELSIKNYAPKDPTPEDNTIVSKVFGYSLSLLNDDKIFNDINEFYKRGINKQHVTRGYKLQKIYVLHNEEKQKKYDEIAAKLGNIKKLWHGTRAVNLLSIMKSGLFCPPRDGNYTISGLMFGRGVYFSDQSTKSLNYATPYWSGGKNELDEIYMLNASVAMGKEYTPKNPINALPSGYDSVYAKAGYSGVMNNEMIVPDDNQFKLDYLCEFVE